MDITSTPNTPPANGAMKPQRFLLHALLLLPTLIHASAVPSSSLSSSSSSNTGNNNDDYYVHDGDYTSYIYEHGAHGDMPYPSDYNSNWAKMSGRMQQPKCVTIPDNLTLCKNIGYTSMLLPNHLEHDTLKEVLQQAASWVPLERIKCHPDTKIFLCSLFSPICLDRPIYPCRSLCLGVKASCEYRMKAHGFDWPEMLDCAQFPEDNDMCIRIVHEVAPDAKCSACNHPMTHESIIDHYCRADIAIRATLKEFKARDGHKELILRKKRRLIKRNPKISKKIARKLTPIIEHGAHCNCDSINQTHQRYLIMGNVQDNELVVTFGMVWNRKDKEFKKGMRAMRKGNLCEGGIFNEISNNNGLDSAAGGGVGESLGKKDRKKRRNRGKGKGKGKGKRKGKGRKRKRGGKKGGKKGRKGRKGRGRKNRNENPPNGGVTTGKDGLSTSQREDQALRNFEKVAK